MVRIPVVAHLEHATEHGGAELALRRLLASSNGRWAPQLLLSGEGDLGVFEGLPSNVEIIRSRVPQPPGASSAGVFGAVGVLWRVVREAVAWRRRRVFRGVDVVHANTSRSALVGALALLGTRTPFVVHLRDRVDAASLGRVGFLAFRVLVARRATSYIANSNSTAQSVRDIARARPVHVLASPIGVERGQAARRIEDGIVHVGMVARIDSWKGQHLLLEAFALSGVGDRARLHFFGDASFGKDDYARRLRSEVERLGLTSVIFEGYVTDIASAIDGLDICVQYSTRPEPLGQNVLQYLARGKATIVADEGGPTEWVVDGRNGVRVAPRDTPALADALRRLVREDELRDSLGRAAMQTPGLPSDEDAAEAHSDVFTLTAR